MSSAEGSAPLNRQSNDYRRGLVRGLTERIARQVEQAADEIAAAWAIARALDGLTGAPEPRAITDILEELVRLLAAAEIILPAPVPIAPDVLSKLAQAGLHPPASLPLPPPSDAQDFTAGVRSGIIRARLLHPTPRRKFRRK